MLVKAILTGGVLSVLAGSIVYFGTEGADALEREIRADVRLEETELAGAAETSAKTIETIVNPQTKKRKKKKKTKLVAEAEQAPEDQVENVAVKSFSQVETPPAESQESKPKTRWLDQYLKSDKPKVATPEPEVEVEDTDLPVEDNVEVEIESEVKSGKKIESGKKMMAIIEDDADPQAMKRVQKKIIIKMDGEKKMVWSSDDEGQMDESADMEMIDKLLREHTDFDLEALKDAKKELRVIKMDSKTRKVKGKKKMARKAIDYDAVLAEAKKLQVIDMRNEAVLEIVDYAVDLGDIGNAADMVDELSSPELRDTARARIGVGLATRGDMEAAFAVLDEIEIDELSAPIRLEIISALMATRAERAEIARLK